MYSVCCNRVRAAAVAETRWQPATDAASPFVLRLSDKGAMYVISFRGVCMLRILFIGGGCNISKT
ncbi:hypothetical protein Hanom_Chr12g01163721 [Helianthus anomalus]